jgi:hypothetical protein
MNRAANSLIGAASADVPVHGGIDFCIRGFGVFASNAAGGHDLSGLTVTALWNLLRDPGLLQRVVRCGDRPSIVVTFLVPTLDTRTAGSDGGAIQMHGTGSALLQASSRILCRSGRRHHG